MTWLLPPNSVFIRIHFEIAATRFPSTPQPSPIRPIGPMIPIQTPELGRSALDVGRSMFRFLRSPGPRRPHPRERVPAPLVHQHHRLDFEFGSIRACLADSSVGASAKSEAFERRQVNSWFDSSARRPVASLCICTLWRNIHPMKDGAQIRDLTFQEAVSGLLAGDFSRLEPLFEFPNCPIVRWYEAGLFATEPDALNEAFTCACFNGKTSVAEYFLARNLNAAGGNATGLNAFHWAANRGQLETVKLLIRHKAPLESRNMYGGSVLGCAVWSAVNEPKPDHLKIIEALLHAGANVTEAEYPTGHQALDQLLRAHRGPNS